MKLSLQNELRNRDPSNVVDEFGDEEEDEAFIKVQEDELKNEIHIYDQVSQLQKKQKEKKKQKQDQKKNNQEIEKQQNKKINSKFIQIEQLDEDEQQKDNKQIQQEENQIENNDENNKDMEGDIALLNEELEYDEKEYMKKNKIIHRKKQQSSLFAYIQKIKDKADDILTPIVQKFLYDPDAIIQKIIGDYQFDDIILFQKYGWSYFEDDEEEDDEEDEELFEKNIEEQTYQNNKKKQKKKKQQQLEQQINKDNIDDNEEQQMNDLKDDLNRIKKQQDLIEKQRQDDEIKIKLLEEKQKLEQEKEQIELRQIIQMNLDKSESYRKDMEKQDINVINLQEIRRLNVLPQSFLEEEQNAEELFKNVKDQLNDLINLNSRFPKEMINKLKKQLSKNNNAIQQLLLVSIKQHSLHPSLFTDTEDEDILLCPTCITEQLKLIGNAIKCMKRIRNK